VALLSPLFLREPLTRGTLLGLVFAIAGGIIIATGDTCSWENGLRCGAPTQASSLWGNFLALVGAWAVSGYLLIGRRLRKTLTLVPYIFAVYGIAALGLLSAGLVARRLVLALPPQTYAWIVLLALVPQLIGHSTYNWALRYLPAASVAVTTLGEPVGSAIRLLIQ
jgi:drug/metabolite transporter (DMT)-like permease